MKPGWWRTNRYWLPLVPVALVAMLAASAYHVKTFFYDDGLHHAVAAAEVGHAVSVDIPYTDAEGRTAYRFRVRADGVSRTEKVTDSSGAPVDIPAGVTAYQVRLSFTADPSVALRYCQLTLVDADGNQYEDALGKSALCVPADHPGPAPAISRGDKRGALGAGEQRPRSWTVAPVILVKNGPPPAEVRLWFALPDYVRLPLPR